MIKLNDRAWGDFKFSELFDIFRGYYNNKPKDRLEGIGIPFVASSMSNNGVTTRFDVETITGFNSLGREDSNIAGKIFPRKSITIANNGSVGATFYHDYEYTTSNAVNVLIPKFKINDYIALFLGVIIGKDKFRWSYGRTWIVGKMKNSTMSIPIDSCGDPDWQFMEDYIKQFEETKLLEIQETDYKDNVTLPSVDEWGSFRLSDLFEITLAKPFFLDKTFDQTDISGTPYITRSSFNNGLVNRLNLEIIDNSLKLINAGDCLTVGAEGKKAFYQNNDFIAGNKVTILRNRNISKPNYFFIIVALDMAMKDVFSYGRAATYGRLIDLNINLPSKDGEPDWELMERYIKSLPYSEMI